MAQLVDKLITFAYLKGEVDIPDGVESKELDHKIYRGQEKLRMLMGDEFYQDFLSNYKANTLSSVYQSLYNPYIKQFVSWQAAAYWVVEANFKPTRSGYRIFNEENSTAVTTDDMTILIKDRKQQSEYYAKLLVDYIKNHASDYPLYDNGCRNLTGNTFHISAVKNRHKHNCDCNSCCR